MREQHNPAPSTEDVIRLLFDLAPHIHIGEHVPGKITMKFSLSGLGVLQNADIKSMDQAIPGIHKARISLWRRSVVIEYDQDQVPYHVWEDLARADHDPERQRRLRDQLRDILDNASA